MKHDDFIKELRLIDNKRLEPGEQFIAQLQLVMRNYVNRLPFAGYAPHPRKTSRD